MKTKYSTSLGAPGKQFPVRQDPRCWYVRVPLGLTLVWLFVLPTTWAATRTVLNLNDSGTNSLREAISVSAAGDAIVFAPGLTGTIALTSGELGIGRNLTITGPGSHLLSLSNSGVSRVINIASSNAVVTLSGLTISAGRAYGANGTNLFQPGGNGEGGGIFNLGTLMLMNCNLVNNQAWGGYGFPGGHGMGGGIYNSGSLALVNCLLWLNSAAGGSSIINGGGSGGGGGIWSQGALALTNCTVVRNSATGEDGGSLHYPGPGGGGGIQSSGATASILAVNCTIVENSAIGGRSTSDPTAITPGGDGTGGGLFVVSGTATFQNSIVAGNTVAGGWGVPPGSADAPDVSGPVSSSGHNLVGKTDGSSGWNVSDLTGIIAAPFNPLLGPLQNNGGPRPNQTMLPQPGSAAIDSGDDAVANTLATDQRGFPRKCGAHVDIGAAEVYAPPTLTLGRTPAGVTISWPSPFIGFQLQENSGVFRTNWVTPSQALADNGIFKSITVNAPAGHRLYRLVSPANNAIRFDGQQSRVYVSHRSELNLFPFTVTCWIKTSQSSPQAKGLVSKYADASGYGYSLVLINGRARAWYFRDPSNYVWDGDLGLDGGVVADGNWHHLAFVVDATGGTLYVDGVAAANQAWAGTPIATASVAPLMFGNYDGQSSLEGLMDEVTLWNRALSQSEVTAQKNSKLAGNEAGLVGYWTFIEGNGDTANDQTGHGYYGTLLNGAIWMPSDAPLAP